MTLQTFGIGALLALILFFTGRRFFKSLKSGGCGCGCGCSCNCECEEERSETQDTPAVEIDKPEERH